MTILDGILNGKTKVVHPTAVVVHRTESVHRIDNTPMFSGQVPTIVNPHSAPRPVDYTSAYAVGRDPYHAPTPLWHFQSLAIADKLSIRAWEGAGDALTLKVPSALIVGMPLAGGMNPARERADIVQPTQTTYASLAALDAPSTAFGPASYAKLA